MGESKLRHVVMFGFSDEATPDVVDEIVRRFVALKDLVPGIEAFEWGVNNSPEGKNHGLTHCFILTFASEAARDAYLPHPDHKAFSGYARQYIVHATVVDYWASDYA